MKKPLARRGFSLVEVTVAIGITAFCLIALLGLLPAGVTSNRDSNRQATAANLATGIVADLRAAAATATATPRYALSLSGATSPLYLNEDGSPNPNATGAAGPLFLLSVTVTPPAAPSRAASTAWIRITWNAAANSTRVTPAGSYETVVSLDRN